MWANVLWYYPPTWWTLSHISFQLWMVHLACWQQTSQTQKPWPCGSQPSPLWTVMSSPIREREVSPAHSLYILMRVCLLKTPPILPSTCPRMIKPSVVLEKPVISLHLSTASSKKLGKPNSESSKELGKPSRGRKVGAAGASVCFSDPSLLSDETLQLLFSWLWWNE